MKLNFKKIIAILILLLIYIFCCAFSYTGAVCKNITDSIFRLHVIANSNSEEDQQLKYKVRDSVLDYFNSISFTANTKEEAMALIKNHLPNIEKIAQEKVYAEGYSYSVTVEIGNFYFPTKTYGEISLPPAYYDSLRIKIGEASGENWWCAMFPALCFIDPQKGIVSETSKEYLEENLPNEEFNLISEQTINSNIKFKCVELLQNVSNSGIFI